ncbi:MULTISPECIES: ribosome small subunit-dependent GTPase A [Lapidilactobacillus]|uniref:Small ribosomal subunit biogenesis GTPase RsgA n=1 Tax=Lapidilactobacillus achengensis TaxID=2486000 RepID=A0ABW1UPG4_9LACO|nr:MULTISPECIES: ribosome small subunit-dependent GTPase A [Lapidilactobacillus]
MSLNLTDYGLTTHFQQAAENFPDLFIARISGQQRQQYRVLTAHGEAAAEVSGKLVFQATDPTDFPAVGDWVLLDRADDQHGNAIIQQILPRTSALARQAAGNESKGQMIAANIDQIFICMSLNADFNLRRLERYLTIAWDSQAQPVVVLTKADLCDDLADKIAQVAAISIGVDIITCSSENGQGFSEIQQALSAGTTGAFIGSSGVGKSTLINRLLGQDKLATKAIRADDAKGRHTTTHRELFLLPDGGLVIDTPGMRELQIYTGDLDRTFTDIATLATQCKFNDCQHQSEPGCAVQAALASGELAPERWASYQKLQHEMAYDGLNSRQLENEKLNRMFGSRGAVKDLRKRVKKRH